MRQEDSGRFPAGRGGLGNLALLLKRPGGGLPARRSRGRTTRSRPPRRAGQRPPSPTRCQMPNGSPPRGAALPAAAAQSGASARSEGASPGAPSSPQPAPQLLSAVARNGPNRPRPHRPPRGLRRSSRPAPTAAVPAGRARPRPLSRPPRGAEGRQHPARRSSSGAAEPTGGEARCSARHQAASQLGPPARPPVAGTHRPPRGREPALRRSGDRARPPFPRRRQLSRRGRSAPASLPPWPRGQRR